MAFDFGRVALLLMVKLLSEALVHSKSYFANPILIFFVSESILIGLVANIDAQFSIESLEEEGEL